jgi:prolyl-tRNA editing enzyme YbaK/EbsC (Cys-tRNA(Pro) deacylase)
MSIKTLVTKKTNKAELQIIANDLKLHVKKYNDLKGEKEKCLSPKCVKSLTCSIEHNTK